MTATTPPAAPSRPGRRVAVALTTLLALCVTALPVAAHPGRGHGHGHAHVDELFLPTPDPDPFYAQPRAFMRPGRHTSRHARPGTILDSRPIEFSPAPDTVLPDVDAWHVKFVSRDEQWRPVAAVATVVRPISAGENPTPLLSYQIPYNSVGTVCAPSHSFSGDNHHPMHGFYSPHLLSALDRGWAVVIPDHLGPASSFGAVRGSARLTLDAIRAAQAFEPLGLAAESATPVGLDGWSMGGWNSLWASIYAPEYAPELNIVGVSVQGAEVEIEDVGRAIDGEPIYGPALWSSFIGNARANPQYVRADMFTRAGKQVIRAMRDGCNHQTTDGSDVPSEPIGNYMTVEPFDSPESQTYFAEIELPQPGLVPGVPLYIAHALQDQVVPVQTVRDAVSAWCDAGADVLLDTPPGEHISSYTYGATIGHEYLDAAFTGTPFLAPATAVECGAAEPLGILAW